MMPQERHDPLPSQVRSYLALRSRETLRSAVVLIKTFFQYGDEGGVQGILQGILPFRY